MNHTKGNGGIEYLHQRPLCDRAITGVPNHFTRSDAASPLEILITGDTQLENGDDDHRHRAYTLNRIAVHAINVMFHLQTNRDEQLHFEDIDRYGADECTFNSTHLWRSLDALDHLRWDIDGDDRGEFIVRSGRGSGSHPTYEISPDIFFTDVRR